SPGALVFSKASPRLFTACSSAFSSAGVATKRSKVHCRLLGSDWAGMSCSVTGSLRSRISEQEILWQQRQFRVECSGDPLGTPCERGTTACSVRSSLRALYMDLLAGENVRLPSCFMKKYTGNLMARSREVPRCGNHLILDERAWQAFCLKFSRTARLR